MTPDDVVSAAEAVIDDIRAHGHHIGFDYAGVRTSYHSDEATTAEWIRRFLEGYFSPSEGSEPGIGVYSTGDPALHAALQGLTASASAEGKDDRLPIADSVVLVRKTAGKVRPPEVVFQLLFAKERTMLQVTSGNLEVRREEGMQTLRAAGKWLLLEQGWIPLHSACAARDGRVICVTGQKASGKTSTLLNLLARNGCDLVAVDKFLVRDGGARIEVCGIPGKIGIRVGSAMAQPHVLDWLGRASASFFPHLGLDEVRHIAATHTPEQLRTRQEKVHLLPSELADLFGRSITPTAPLGLLLIPVFDPTLDEARLVRTEPEQARRTLAECYVSLGSKGEDVLRHFFDLGDTLIQERLAALLATHLPGVAAYEIHQSARTNQQAAELVAGLL